MDLRGGSESENGKEGGEHAEGTKDGGMEDSGYYYFDDDGSESERVKARTLHFRFAHRYSCLPPPSCTFLCSPFLPTYLSPPAHTSSHLLTA
jgi:hypothetical protein